MKISVLTERYSGVIAVARWRRVRLDYRSYCGNKGHYGAVIVVSPATR